MVKNHEIDMHDDFLPLLNFHSLPSSLDKPLHPKMFNLREL